MGSRREAPRVVAETGEKPTPPRGALSSLLTTLLTFLNADSFSILVTLVTGPGS